MQRGRSGPDDVAPGEAADDSVELDLEPVGHVLRRVALPVGIAAGSVPIVLYVAAQRPLVEAVTWWVIILTAVAIAVIALARTVKRVQVTGSSVIVTRLVGPPVAHARAILGTGVLVTSYLRYGSPAKPLLILVDRTGRKLLYLAGPRFTVAHLRTLMRALGTASFDVIDGDTTPQMLDEQRPGLLWFGERRPWTFAVLVTVGICVIATVALRAAGV